MNVIELKKIYKSYRSGNHAANVLSNLELDVRKGEFLSIIGTSGQGKSTLLNLLGCLDVPDSGHYYLNQQLVEWKSAQRLAEIRGRQIAMIFQNYELVSHWTVIENVEMGLRFHGVKQKERRMKALVALKQVNLLHESNKFPHELSGGEQQRCAIARALCTNPEVILADEPTGNLDPENARQILELLKNLNLQGKTIVFVTHDHQLAKEAHRVAVLRNGQIEWWSESHVG